MFTKEIWLLLIDHTRTSFHLSKLDGVNGHGRKTDPERGLIGGPSVRIPLFSSFRVQGRVTTSCLWHSCRAVTIGAILIASGITMAIMGK